MKISVVIPAHNEEKYIKKCLISLVRQDFNDFEIIVCLNACTDKTENIVKQFRHIKRVKEDQKGVVYARRKGTILASGQIIASADADTIYPKDWLSSIALNFQKNSKSVGLYGPVYLKDGPFFLKILAKYFYTPFLYLSKLLNKDNVAGMNFAFRKDIFDKVKGYNLDLKSAEDVDLAKRLKKFGKIDFDKNLIVWTSSRRFEKKFFRSLLHHVKNYFRVFVFKKTPEEFEDIR